MRENAAIPIEPADVEPLHTRNGTGRVLNGVRKGREIQKPGSAPACGVLIGADTPAQGYLMRARTSSSFMSR